jgi:hypothetical protein
MAREFFFSRARIPVVVLRDRFASIFLNPFTRNDFCSFLTSTHREESKNGLRTEIRHPERGNPQTCHDMPHPSPAGMDGALGHGAAFIPVLVPFPTNEQWGPPTRRAAVSCAGRGAALGRTPASAAEGVLRVLRRGSALALSFAAYRASEQCLVGAGMGHVGSPSVGVGFRVRGRMWPTRFDASMIGMRKNRVHS